MKEGNEIDLKRINDKIRSAQPLEFQFIMLHEYDKLLSKKHISKRKPLLPLNLLKLVLQKSLNYRHLWQKQQNHYLSMLSFHKFFRVPQHTVAIAKRLP